MFGDIVVSHSLLNCLAPSCLGTTEWKGRKMEQNLETDLEELRIRAQAVLSREWFAQGHYHRLKGCICLSCDARTGFELESNNALDCEDVTVGMSDYASSDMWPPNEVCRQTVMSWEEASFFAESPSVILDLINRIHELTNEP